MDTVAEFLTRIRNAGASRHEKVDIPASKLRAGLAEILAKKGLIRSYKVAKDSKQGVMRVYLRYSESGEHAINSITRVSRPGRRVYVKSTEIPVVRSGLGTSILSTSKGLMSGDEAQKMNLGGELICKIW
ncbi:MAG: 30S ribosomal protein S8 [Pseudobdellovibrionaceae bacterium]|jgi:small subunit ribosomal protein S8|nr:30S ribosomal protein S8 [Pseudomonadota bacterium]